VAFRARQGEIFFLPTDIHIALVDSVALAFQHCIKIILVSDEENLGEKKSFIVRAIAASQRKSSDVGARAH
jgi:hypothetical protein